MWTPRSPPGSTPHIRTQAETPPPASARRSGGVVEDQAEGVPAAGPDRGHPVPDRRGRPAARRGDRPVAGGEDQPVALRDQRGGSPRLRAGPLLDQQEL